MKQTSVEWLESQILEGSINIENGEMYIKLPKDALKKAKEMEKKNKLLFGKKVADHWGMVNVPLENIEQYYNETFKSE